MTSLNNEGASPITTGAKGEAQPGVYEGKLVRVEGHRLVMTNGEGKEFSHTLAKDAQLTCDGKKCESAQMPSGSRIRVTTQKNDRNVATIVESLSKESSFAKV